MKIKWFGQSCFLLTSDNGIKIVMDPYKNALGYKLPALEAQIVTTSHEHSDHNNIGAVSGCFEHISSPGQFTIHGIEIKGVGTFHDNVSGAKKGNNNIYTVRCDGLNVCHCGDLGHRLDEAQIEAIGKVDILLLPVGGTFTLDAKAAVEVSKQLHPSVVIPMHYRTKALGIPGLIFNTVDDYLTASKMKPRRYDTLDLSPDNLEDYAGIAVLKYDWA